MKEITRPLAGRQSGQPVCVENPGELSGVSSRRDSTELEGATCWPVSPSPADSTITFCSRGDTIETVEPVQFGSFAGNRLRVKVVTPEACAEANELIMRGRWRVAVDG